MNKRKTTAITVILILVFSGWYVYFNTSLASLTLEELTYKNVPFEKYLKCAKEGEAARVNDSDVDIPAHCCKGLKVKNAQSRTDSTLWLPAFTGDIQTCVK